MSSPRQLRTALDAIVGQALSAFAPFTHESDTGADGALKALSHLRLGAGLTVGVCERELRALGARDRARITAELAMTCALLHHKFRELDPASADRPTPDLQALTVPLTAPRKDHP
jgi:hypothetical protein